MNKVLTEQLRKEYVSKLLEALKEVDILDKAGNILISKDLKVFHKDSGYEYTVNDVVNTPEGIKIVLRLPDTPRPIQGKATRALDEISTDDQENDGDLRDNTGTTALSDIIDGDMFIVDEESFEKEYGVK
ncbi:MAG: hypothetical protein H8E12_25015 [Rhodobacteraceae bacterium]|nr:hypothetical protein [Paracoccaceae bacterium]